MATAPGAGSSTADPPTRDRRRALDLLTLRELRREILRRSAGVLVVCFAVIFGFVSMVLGQMIVFEPVGGEYFVAVVGYAGGGRWWDFPELIAVQPWGTLVLPFFPAISMVLVSIGAGIGGALGAGWLIDWARNRWEGGGRNPTAGAAASLAPAVTGLATLGACCCTSCAGAVGVAVVAGASGVEVGQLVAADWYIGVFQLAVVYVSLIAQEQILRRSRTRCDPILPRSNRYLASVVLRFLLVIAGITWALAMFVEWGELDPLSAPASVWYHWLFEHQLLATVAVAAGLFPEPFCALLRRVASRRALWAFRGALATAAVSWGIWVPAPLVRWGLGGLLNELFGILGLPEGWGAVPPDSSGGLPLIFHLALQHLLLAGFALAAAAAPIATARILGTEGPEPTPGADPTPAKGASGRMDGTRGAYRFEATPREP